jgi:hypothetical protein
MEWLDRGYKDRWEHMLYLGLEPLLTRCAATPRFILLTLKVALP